MKKFFITIGIILVAFIGFIIFNENAAREEDEKAIALQEQALPYISGTEGVKSVYFISTGATVGVDDRYWNSLSDDEKIAYANEIETVLTAAAYNIGNISSGQTSLYICNGDKTYCYLRIRVNGSYNLYNTPMRMTSSFIMSR